MKVKIETAVKKMYVSSHPTRFDKKEYNYIAIELTSKKDVDKKIIEMIPNINIAVETGNESELIVDTLFCKGDNGKSISFRCLTEKQIKKDSIEFNKTIEKGKKIIGL